MALFLIGLILAIGCIVFSFISIKKFINENSDKNTIKKVEGKNKILFLICIFAEGIFTIISSIGLSQISGWNLTAGKWILFLVGSYLFGASISLVISSFYLYYYCILYFK